LSVKRYNARRDKNEPEILRALSAAGADYILLDPFDVLVLYRGRIVMLECKVPKKGRKTVNQQILVDRGWPVHFVTTAEAALAAIGATV
jgi:hypothetical protein